MDPQPQPTPSRADYVRQVLAAYGQTPGTTGQIHGPDRLLADQLYQRGVPLKVVENALLLAAARRLLRPPQAAPLSTIRSLAYFLPVIDEVLQLRVGQEYFQYVRSKLQRSFPKLFNQAISR